MRLRGRAFSRELRLVLAAGAFAQGAVGCAASRTIRPTALPALPPVTLEDALGAYEAFCAATRTVSASGDLDVRDTRAGKARSLGVRLVATRGGRLYLKGSVTVVTALEVVADGARFWFQVPSRKTVWTGRADTAPDRDSGAEDASAPYYALRPADVLAALLPEPLLPTSADTLALEADGQDVSLTLSRPEAGRGYVRRRVALSREGLRPRLLRAYDALGELQSEIVLGGFVGGHPRTLEVRRPREGYEARLRLDKLDLNVAVPDRAFIPRTPPEYKTVEVR